MTPIRCPPDIDEQCRKICTATKSEKMRLGLVEAAILIVEAFKAFNAGYF